MYSGSRWPDRTTHELEDPNVGQLSLGASPRATVALFRAARAAAVLDGRNFVTPDDVKGVTPAVLRHRINLAPELEVEGRSADDVLSALLARVRVPE